MKHRFLSLAFLVAVAAAGSFLAYKMFHVPQQTEILLLFVLAMFYPVMRYPILGLYLFFAISPFIMFFRRLYYLAYQRPSVDPLIILGEVIIIFVFVGLFFRLRERDPQSNPPDNVSRLVFLYFAYMLLRVFVLSHGTVSYNLTCFKYYGPAVLLFFLGKIFADRFALLRRIWLITVIVGVLSALYALKQLYLGYSEAENLWISSTSFSTLIIQGVIRPFSFFPAPSVLADYLLLAILGVVVLKPLGVALPLPGSLGLIALFCYGILLTSVRSSWIGVMVAFALLVAFVNLGGWRRRAAVAVGLAAGYLILEFAFESMGVSGGVGAAVNAVSQQMSKQQYLDLLVSSRTTAITDPLAEHSFVSRVQTWRLIIESSGDLIYGVAGRGLGQFNADSLYFTYLAEFGYPGLALILVIVIAFIRTGLRVADTAPDPRVAALARIVTVMNMTFAFVNITGTHINAFPGDAYFWFWNGVLANSAVLARSLSAPDRDIAPRSVYEGTAHA